MGRGDYHIVVFLTKGFSQANAVMSNREAGTPKEGGLGKGEVISVSAIHEGSYAIRGSTQQQALRRMGKGTKDLTKKVEKTDLFIVKKPFYRDGKKSGERISSGKKDLRPVQSKTHVYKGRSQRSIMHPEEFSSSQWRKKGPVLEIKLYQSGTSKNLQAPLVRQRRRKHYHEQELKLSPDDENRQGIKKNRR